MDRPAAAVAVALLLLAPPGPARAANPDLVVSKFSDSFDGVCDADCSLREAVQLAGQTPGRTASCWPPDATR